jgi:Site-specific recombinase XerD
MATYKIFLFSGNVRKDGTYPVSIRITKDRKSKLISTNLTATEKGWNSELARYVCDKRITPEYKKLNARISELEAKINGVMRNFENNQIDWTLNQFEEIFLNKTPRGNVKEYFWSLITTLRDIDRFGNAKCYFQTLRMLELFDNRFGTRVFSEIDIKYVKTFDVFLQKRGCIGNTRKFYFKVLRACMNKAIQDKEASGNTYPFGKGGFNVASLEEETAKRYLPNDCMEKLKSTVMKNSTLEMTRKLFLFTYYCYGISFIDTALLSRNNIIRYNGGNYIVYKRHKTKDTKKVKSIQIKITNTIQELLDWFKSNTILVEGYLLPIVSKEGYKGQQLYNHIRNRFSQNNKNLKNLATTLEITGMKLTSYVARHTMAMTLQDNQIPREVISQILGHSDLATTNTYLDSFDTTVIDEAAKVL